MAARLIESLLRSGVVFGGTYKIPGTARRAGVVCKKRVWLIARTGGRLIRELWSGTDGVFSFDGIRLIEQGYIVMELDDLSNDPWFDPACADRVTPEPMP